MKNALYSFVKTLINILKIKDYFTFKYIKYINLRF